MGLAPPLQGPHSAGCPALDGFHPMTSTTWCLCIPTRASTSSLGFDQGNDAFQKRPISGGWRIGGPKTPPRPPLRSMASAAATQATHKGPFCWPNILETQIVNLKTPFSFLGKRLARLAPQQNPVRVVNRRSPGDFEVFVIFGGARFLFPVLKRVEKCRWRALGW